MTGIYSTMYLGPVSYFADMLQYNEVLIDGTEKWQKQTYRNRCYIDSPGGVLMLNIPIVHSTNKATVSEVEISYEENWYIRHWQALKTSYGSSPFFEVLSPEIKDILYSKELSLLKLNISLFNFCLEYLNIKKSLKIIRQINDLPDHFDDRRMIFHPKIKEDLNFPAYPQVFDHKNNFVPNLSIIDLLFNEGPAAYDYLRYINLYFRKTL